MNPISVVLAILIGVACAALAAGVGTSIAHALFMRRVRRTHQQMVAERSMPLLFDAWTLIASVNRGDWTRESPDWQLAAAAFRRDYFAAKKAADEEATRG